MNDLERYERVNAAETYEDLALLIEYFAEDGMIRGRTRSFSSKNMAEACRNFDKYYLYAPNVLTRMWGIRQQAMMIRYYGEQE